MKKILFTDKAPAPIGPYNQAVLSGNTLYTSGQIAINPATGDLVLDSIEIETKQVMENMKAVLESAGMTFENVVKSTIFISNMNDFAAINSIYGSYFNEKTAPARETVQVACLPKNVNVEMIDNMISEKNQSEKMKINQMKIYKRRK
jgi:2-iminobutanoate/2-iminopropanoate deaminase